MLITRYAPMLQERKGTKNKPKSNKSEQWFIWFTNYKVISTSKPSSMIQCQFENVTRKETDHYISKNNNVLPSSYSQTPIPTRWISHWHLPTRDQSLILQRPGHYINNIVKNKWITLIKDSVNTLNLLRSALLSLSFK